MSVMSTDQDAVFFEFESDFVASLRCIPMIVRFKLDLCGVKLSLKGWSRFDHDTRFQCAHLPTRSDREVDRYGEFLCHAIQQVGLDPVLLPQGPEPAWRQVDFVPVAVLEKGAELGISPEKFADWSRLSSLQRLALIKLTRRGHENANFLPALVEFGLV